MVALAPGTPLTSRAESGVESAPCGAGKAPMDYLAPSIPLEERMGASARISPWEVADHLTEDLNRHTAGEHRDDMTALAVRGTG
ncbi:hypothetical protein WBG99_02745 [Streptomyces sp. TG1A-60]|uniref:hypothetical protein n=1 Tax=Streptomyces sp. TG1A-60 TaxID=3129111 RepID=UPI0030D3364B